MPWLRELEEPIRLPDNRELKTLSDAAHYIIELPPEIVRMPHWQLAMEALSRVTERSPTTLARRAFLNALSSTATPTLNAKGK